MFFPGRNGPARPSAAGRSRPPGHSRPLYCRAGWAQRNCHVFESHKPSRAVGGVCHVIAARAYKARTLRLRRSLFHRELVWSVYLARSDRKEKQLIQEKNLLDLLRSFYTTSIIQEVFIIMAENALNSSPSLNSGEPRRGDPVYPMLYADTEEGQGMIDEFVAHLTSAFPAGEGGSTIARFSGRGRRLLPRGFPDSFNGV